MTHWSSRRLTAGFILALWATMFWALIISGRSALFLSSRVAWVIPLGAVGLTVAAVGRFASARSHAAEPISSRELAGSTLLALPAVLILALPPASLGSFATGRRSNFVSAGFVSSVDDVSSGELSLADVAGAVRSDEAMRALVARAGEEVSFTGFVTRDEGMPADEFLLSRFVISCCVADALAVQVRIVDAPPGELKEDQWVRVTGLLYPLGSDVVVTATSVDKVPRPERPYLSP